MALKAKRALSCLLTVLLLLTMLPVGVFATDDSKGDFGITGENITVSQIPEANEAELSEAARVRYWGLYFSSESTLDPSLGRIHSACHIESSASSAPDYVTITMDKPIQDSTLEAPNITTGWAVLALVDGELVTYPTKEVDNGKLKFDVRLGENGVDLALAALFDASKFLFGFAAGDWGTLKLVPGDIIFDDSLGYVRPYTLTLELSEGVKTRLQNEWAPYSLDLIFYLNSIGLKIDVESISFNGNELFQLDPEQTERVGDGCYKFTAQVDIDAWEEGNYTNTVGISYAAPNAEPLLFEGEVQVSLPPPNPWAGMMGCVPLPITVVEPPEDVDTYHKITVTQTDGGKISPRGVEGEVWVPSGKSQTFTITPDLGYHIEDVKVDGQSVDAQETYTFEQVNGNHTITATFAENPTVTITPANLTIYEGGDAGYEGVVDEDGEKITSTSSFPEPLFKITMPEGSEPVPTGLTFTNNISSNSWYVQEAGTDSAGTTYYRLVNTKNPDNLIRVQFIGEDGNVIESDTVTTTDEVFDTHKIAIFSDENDVVTATAGETDYNVTAEKGKLTVRAVADTDPTSAIAAAAPTEAPITGEATAVAPAGTTYTIGETGVSVSGGAPSLLFDSIIEDADSTARTDALEDRIQTVFGEDTTVYEIKYLDLVDANNGNAWIKADKPVDIYWGYPTGTNQSTTFTVVHFKDLHRDGDQSGYDTADIASCQVETIQAVSTDQGIKFSVQPGQFSPFALVQEIAEEPEPIPTPDPGDDDNPPYIPPVDPDDTGVSDLLNTEDHIQYLFGYPNGTFGPENDMTRAEVAQMFYNLLLDQDVTITKTFEDVPEDAWYAKAVNTLASLGVVSGVGDNKFEPERSITRAEFTTITMRFTNGMMDGENIFPDVNADDWFYDYVVGSIQYGWIHGYPDGTFRPNNPITRAEVTAIVNNMLGREADEDFVDEHAEELTQFSDIEKHWAYYHIAEATNDHDYTQPSSGENWTRLN